MELDKMLKQRYLIYGIESLPEKRVNSYCNQKNGINATTNKKGFATIDEIEAD